MATGNISSIHVFSPHGEDMLERFLNNSNCRIIMAREFLENEDYDEFGVGSNSWFLFIITQDFNTAKYNYYYFYTSDQNYTFDTIDVNCTCSVKTNDRLVLPKLENIKLSKMFEFWNTVECQSIKT